MLNFTGFATIGTIFRAVITFPVRRTPVEEKATSPAFIWSHITIAARGDCQYAQTEYPIKSLM